MIRIFLLCVFINICECRSELYEGDTCTKDGANGTCIDIGHCPQAIDEVKRKMKPQICSFKDITPIVCCVNHTSMLAIPLKTTTQATLPQSADDCEPLSPRLTAAKTGRKAWDKCIEYQELVYPCGESIELDLLGGKSKGTLKRLNKCHRAIGMLIIRGTETYDHEFPHMVRLGTTGEGGKMEWIERCAGALISDRFVLATAHCTIGRGNAVTHVRLDSKVTHGVKGVIRHPEYRPPKTANDIALIELETPAVLDDLTVPACLPVIDEEVLRLAIAVGWDIIYSKDSDTLQMSTSLKVPAEQCLAALNPLQQKHTGGQYNCYQGSFNYTCLGSGEILQVASKHNYCMHELIGLGAFFGGCGGPGAYTTIASYVPWIEDIVWK